jgi:hypothetical protein
MLFSYGRRKMGEIAVLLANGGLSAWLMRERKLIFEISHERQPESAASSQQ